MGGLPWEVVLLIGAVAVLGAFVQSVVGLGLGLLCAPVVALVEPGLVPVLPLWLALLLSGAMVLGERAHVEWRAIAWALPARVPGTLLGAWLVVHASERAIAVAVGVMVLVAVAVTGRRLQVPVTPPTLVAAGFTAGVAGTATSIGGPPIALVLQHRSPEVLRSTLAVFFFLGIVLSLAGLFAEGALPREAGVLALVMAPGVLGGLAVGRRVRQRVHRERFRRAVLVVCAVSAGALLVRSVLPV